MEGRRREGGIEREGDFKVYNLKTSSSEEEIEIFYLVTALYP